MKRCNLILLWICLVSGCSIKGEEHKSYEIDQRIETNANTSLLQENIREIMNAYQLNEENFAISYENLVTHQSYDFNATKLMIGASTVKVPINMMYYDNSYDIENASLLYTFIDYEEGEGYCASLYEVGDHIPLSFLMKQSILYSDNTAINIMLRCIGYQAFKEYYASFIEIVDKDKFYYYNVTSAKLLQAISLRLYEHSSQYSTLLEDMKLAMPRSYMKRYLPNVEIAHKYGLYETYEHDFGIVYATQPFSLAILTKNVENAEQIIGEITYMIYEYQENTK